MGIGIGRLCLMVLSCALGTAEAKPAKESFRYLRPAGENKFESECDFAIVTSDDDGWQITSTTRRGTDEFTVHSRYDAKGRLLEAVVSKKDSADKVTVKAEGEKATVTQSKKADAPEMIRVPKEVIVTSAPDWTDTFLLCRRYDRAKGGKQEFPGLWIHPTQATKQPSFQVERVGEDAIEHDGKKLALQRLEIELRKGSNYVAWIDGETRMIKLVPLPYKEGTNTGLVLEGFEKPAAKLWPEVKKP